MTELQRQMAAQVCYFDEGKQIPMHVFRGGDRCQCGHLSREVYQRIGARMWNDGVMFRDLEAALPIGTVICMPRSADCMIRGVRPDGEAGPEHLAWLSPTATPERVAACRAGVLILTEALAQYAMGCCLVTEHPKWLFSELVAQFFAPELLPPWTGTRSPDAQIGCDVMLGPGVVVGRHVKLGNRVRIGPNTVLTHTEVHDDVVIGANCSIGLEGFGYAETPKLGWRRIPHLGRVVIESNVEIGSSTCIDRGVMGDTVIRYGAKIDNLVHIAHNCEIGEHALVIANAMIAGSSKVGVHAWVAPSVSTRDHITIGDAAVVGVGAVVVKDVPPAQTVAGNPAKPLLRAT